MDKKLLNDSNILFLGEVKRLATVLPTLVTDPNKQAGLHTEGIRLVNFTNMLIAAPSQSGTTKGVVLPMEGVQKMQDLITCLELEGLKITFEERMNWSPGFDDMAYTESLHQLNHEQLIEKLGEIIKTPGDTAGGLDDKLYVGVYPEKTMEKLISVKKITAINNQLLISSKFPHARKTGLLSGQLLKNIDDLVEPVGIPVGDGGQLPTKKVCQIKGKLISIKGTGLENTGTLWKFDIAFGAAEKLSLDAKSFNSGTFPLPTGLDLFEFILSGCGEKLFNIVVTGTEIDPVESDIGTLTMPFKVTCSPIPAKDTLTVVLKVNEDQDGDNFDPKKAFATITFTFEVRYFCTVLLEDF